MTDACPAPEELARAVSHGATTEVATHVADCESCSAEWRGASDVRLLAQELAALTEEPAAAAVSRVRAQVVREGRALHRRKRTRTELFVAFALAAAAVLGIGLGRFTHAPSLTATAPVYHGTITAVGSARFRHASGVPDELVVLEQGTIHVEVSPLRPGERFRVRAGDGEVEVRGTAFDVAIDDGHLSRVTVDHGRVEVHGAGAAMAVLGAGEHWAVARALPAPEATVTDVPPTPEPPKAPAPHISTPRAPNPVPETATEAPSAAPAPPPTPPPAPEIAARHLVESASAPPPPAPLPTATAPAATNAAPGDTRNDERRERRDERRERHDQRRLR